MKEKRKKRKQKIHIRKGIILRMIFTFMFGGIAGLVVSIDAFATAGEEFTLWAAIFFIISGGLFAVLADGIFQVLKILIKRVCKLEDDYFDYDEYFPDDIEEDIKDDRI